jgi:hypothetical protein
MSYYRNAASGKTLEVYKANAANAGSPPVASSSGSASPTGGVPGGNPPAGTTVAGGATPTKSGPLLATANAAPKQVSNAAGLTGLLVAAFAFMGL